LSWDIVEEMNVKPKPISDELLALMAEKFRMLGEPTRLAILHSLMSDGEMNVGQVVAATGRSVANVSKHLKQLAEADLVSRRKEGSFVLYRLDDPVLEKLCEMVCESLRHDLEEQLRSARRVLKRARG
jgi:DNA-binding transcriptional ArsR family regulator